MAIVVSEALPVHFWPIGEPTFNESINAFIDTRPFYQEWLTSDTIKLQISNETNNDNAYGLRIVDCDGVQIGYLDFTKTIVSGKYCFDVEFTWSSLSLPDQYARFYISLNPGTLDDETLDSETLDTLGSGTDIYKSDYHLFSSDIPLTQSYGTKLAYYKSDTNFAGIKYPNNGHYFAFRLPCRFYKTRGVKVTTHLDLSQSNIVTTSIIRTKQQLLKIILLPHYILDKIEDILDHCPKGSVIIDGIEWQDYESFDRADVDERCAFDMASTWLSKGVIRNII